MRNNAFWALSMSIGEDKGSSRHPQNASTLNTIYGSDFAVDTDVVPLSIHTQPL